MSSQEEQNFKKMKVEQLKNILRKHGIEKIPKKKSDIIQLFMDNNIIPDINPQNNEYIYPSKITNRHGRGDFFGTLHYLGKEFSDFNKIFRVMYSSDGTHYIRTIKQLNDPYSYESLSILQSTFLADFISKNIYPPIKKLDLSDIGLSWTDDLNSPSSLSTILNSLNGNDTIELLNLSSNNSSDGSDPFQLFSHTILSNPPQKLEELIIDDMSGYGVINNEEFANFCRILRKNKTLRSLSLEGNQLSVWSLLHFFDMLKHNKYLRSVNLKRCFGKNIMREYTINYDEQYNQFQLYITITKIFNTNDTLISMELTSDQIEPHYEIQIEKLLRNNMFNPSLLSSLLKELE